MKKLVVSLFFVALTVTVFAQPKIDLGLKGGVNFSKMSLDMDDYNSESVLKSHIGAFARLGWGRVFVQPEAYFSGKGGDITSSITKVVTAFDYNTIDVPVLLGVSLIKGEMFDLHAVAGPVFNGIATKDIKGDDYFHKDYYENHYFSMQYGLGIDVLFITLDARIEQGLNNFYSHSGIGASNRTFMVSVGFKMF